MVDSTPISVTPPSIIASIRPSISCNTASTVVGLGFPDKLALGPAIGTPQARIHSLVNSNAGHRIATVSSPPEISKGTISFFGKTIVKGPGQKASISFLSRGVISQTNNSTSFLSAT